MNESDCHDNFRALPVPNTRDGKPRRCGIEIEFSGIEEDVIANIIRRELGGHVAQHADHLYVVEDTRIGTVAVELDTRFAKPGEPRVPDRLLDAARAVVPVEIVTAPLPPDQMAELAGLIEPLRQAGAKGTSDTLFAGFGIHFNPEIVAFDDPHTMRTIIAYGLLEPWLREWRPLDMSRRILPFVDPWPTRFVNALIAEPDLTLVEVRRLCSEHLSGRNYGLDLLPILYAYDAEAFERIFGADASAARPAFHFRLPDCRIDEADWSLTDEWDLWWLVEALAADGAIYDELVRAWPHNWHIGGTWAEAVSQHIGANGERLFG